MRIAIIHLGRKGAGPVFALENARVLLAFGHEVSLYLSSGVENRFEFEKLSILIRYYPTYNSTKEFLMSIIFQKNIKNVVFDVNNFKPDAIYAPMYHVWDPFLFPKLKGIFRIKTIHDVEVHSKVKNPYIHYSHKKQFEDAEAFVVLSEKYVNNLLEKGISKENICVVPHPGFTYYNKFTVSNISTQTGKTLLFFGRIEPYKGLDLLLKSLYIVRQSIPDVVLNIVGSGDITPYEQDIKNLQSNIKLNNVWVKDEDVAGFVSAADIMVLPYIHATQSGVIPLAYAFSKPVVATNVGCLDGQIIDGVTGFLVNEISSEELANKLIFLLKDYKLQQSIGRNAYDFMQKNLTWEIAAKRLSDFIERKI